MQKYYSKTQRLRGLRHPPIPNRSSPLLPFVYCFHGTTEKGWCDGATKLKGPEMFHFGGKNVKGHIRKVMSVNVSLIQPHIPREGRGSASGWRGIWSCFWFIDMVLLSLWDPNKVLAGWPALLGGRAEADGANGIRMPEPHLSAVMAGWQVLMDRWSWRLSWQSRLADELWNETDIQKLWAAQAWTDPPPFTHPWSTGMTASAAMLLSIFPHDWGNVGC